MNPKIIARKIRTFTAASPELRRNLLQHKMRPALRRKFLGAIENPVARIFHRVYYHKPDSWFHNVWFGFPISQFPGDLYLYQEIISRRTPDYIVQTGVFLGGSALFFAHMLDLANAPLTAKVIAIDINLSDKAKELNHPRITLIEGSSTSPETIKQVERLIADIPHVNGGMVSLDSDHTKDHVVEELKYYPQFVGVGNYLVVEDTNINNNPVLGEHGPGPFEALREFLKTNHNFQQDNALWQRNLFSHHQYGWLRKVSE
jgi:cephalosporin hydroxylase